jgi:hypothetical protein
LDEMEKEKTEWETRKRMAPGSKALIALLVIVLLLAGAVAGIKQYAAGSAADAWIGWAAARAAGAADQFAGLFSNQEPAPGGEPPGD